MKFRVIIVFIAYISFIFVSTLPGQTWKVSILPDSAIAGASGSWTLNVTVGQDTITEGGAIKIQFPSGWVNSAWPEGKLKTLQFNDSLQNHYLGFKIFKQNCTANFEVVRKGIDNQYDRFNRSFVLKLTNGELLPGDKLSVYFFNTTPPITSEQHQIAIAYRKQLDEEYFPINEYPSFKVLPGNPEKMRLIAPSQAITGEEVEFKVVITDQFFNSTKFYGGTVTFKADKSITIFPSLYKFLSTDNGTKEFKVKFTKPGIHTITVIDDFNLAPYGVKSNPILVSDTALQNNIYWGDLHAHSGNSKDGVGKAETTFKNARDVAALDFFALTDHGAGDFDTAGNYWVGLTEDEWKENKALVKAYYEPSKFIPFLACEWSGKSPYGHHNIFYRNLEGTFFGEDAHKNIKNIWELIDPINALTIPHHTGIVWPGGSNSYIDWLLDKNDAFRPAIEIYSLWGSSEYYQNSMAYERYHQRNFSSHKGFNYAQDAWALGHYVGVIGGSDEHTSHPGKDEGGLTAVLAKSLNRDLIFDAIRNRHTYATTGQRIVIDYRINNELMGSQVYIDSTDYPEITLKVIGTDVLDTVELLKFNGIHWGIILKAKPNTLAFDSTLIDYNFRNKAIYYLRIKQKNIIENREVRAWTSPIWVSSSVSP